MTKENLNRIGFDTRSQEFTVILANDTRIQQNSQKRFHFRRITEVSEC